MPRGAVGKSMFGGSGNNPFVTSDFLQKINNNTASKGDVKNVEDIQQVIGYYNSIISQINAQKK